MSSMSLWINTVVSVLGVLVGAFLAMGSVISIANMQISWSGALLVSAMLVPVAFAIPGLARGGRIRWMLTNGCII